MDYKTFGENAEISVQVRIVVNDRVVFQASSYDINGAIAELGRAERHNFIGNEIEKQWQELPEPVEDESRGLAV